MCIRMRIRRGNAGNAGSTCELSCFPRRGALHSQNPLPLIPQQVAAQKRNQDGLRVVLTSDVDMAEALQSKNSYSDQQARSNESYGARSRLEVQCHVGMVMDLPARLERSTELHLSS